MTELYASFCPRPCAKISDKVNALPESLPRQSCLARNSPKLCAFLLMVADQAARQEGKILVWCTYPAGQLFVWGCIRLLKIDAMLYTADLKSKSARKIGISNIVRARCPNKVKLLGKFPPKCFFYLQKSRVSTIDVDVFRSISIKTYANGQRASFC